MKHLTSIALLFLVMLVVGVSSFSAGKSKGKKPIVIQSIPAAKLVGNSTTPSQDGLQKSDQKKNNEKVIMMLQTRDHLLTIYSRDEDRLYSVGTKDGIALAERLTSAELKARFPELHEIVTTSVAVDSPMHLEK